MSHGVKSTHGSDYMRTPRGTITEDEYQQLNRRSWASFTKDGERILLDVKTGEYWVVDAAWAAREDTKRAEFEGEHPEHAALLAQQTAAFAALSDEQKRQLAARMMAEPDRTDWSEVHEEYGLLVPQDETPVLSINMDASSRPQP
ncbi:uncharacterized protein LOC62_07G009784 [Vanrija pseudolonga]|uniref:Uncharacterized protein n=1 Tax=Vanrija pseudolonga TaxID=143232 RepID=A0AAF0YH37_9TREE|nr:hypothetical protein LOC62_07G009784 [Vanrija pseudolonga]